MDSLSSVANTGNYSDLRETGIKTSFGATSQFNDLGDSTTFSSVEVVRFINDLKGGQYYISG